MQDQNRVLKAMHKLGATTERQKHPLSHDYTDSFPTFRPEKGASNTGIEEHECGEECQKADCLWKSVHLPKVFRQ